MEDRFNHWAHYDYVFLNDEVSLLSMYNAITDLAAFHRRVQGVSCYNHAMAKADSQTYTTIDQC
jgi:hypothetical protein